MDKLIAIVSIIISIFASVYAIFKKIDSEYHEYWKCYYKKILEPFYYNCVIEGKSVYDFFRENNIVSKYFEILPTYILRLVKDDNEESKDKLYKIMCVDFIDNRPSKNNSMLKSIMMIINAGDYFVLLIFIFIIPTISLLAFIPIIQSSFLNMIFLIAIIIGMIILFRIVVANIKDNTYSLNRKNVSKLIDKKLKEYKNLGEDLFR